jgi:hypothetical protein
VTTARKIVFISVIVLVLGIAGGYAYVLWAKDDAPAAPVAEERPMPPTEESAASAEGRKRKRRRKKRGAGEPTLNADGTVNESSVESDGGDEDGNDGDDGAPSEISLDASNREPSGDNTPGDEGGEGGEGSSDGPRRRRRRR